MSKAQILQKENEMMDRAFEDLLNDYINSPHSKKVDIIRKAYQFAKTAHAGVRRRSGEPYIIHPIAVAHIVCKDIGLGSTSICSALLHDVVEDTDYTVDDRQPCQLFQIYGNDLTEGFSLHHGVENLANVANGNHC